MDSLFFDILGAVIGFVAVLLLLSMVVTALVQATQALLRLRARNLLFGLAGVLAEQADMPPEAAKEKARAILTAKGAPMLRGRIDPLGSVGKWLGPQVSWLDVDELRQILGDCVLDVSGEVRLNIIDRFDTVQKALSKRFLRNMRLWTIVWALPVAFYFQVSAPALLNDLLTDPQLRAGVLQLAPEVLTQTEARLDSQLGYDAVSAQARERLAAAHPEHRAQIDKARGTGQSKAEVVAELSRSLGDDPRKPALIEEYQRLLDESHQAAVDAALETATAAAANLRQFNIDPWHRGWDFYVYAGKPQLNNWVGVLMTTILLSFGAPFWFNALRYLMNLRDTLKPSSKAKGKPS